MNTGEGAIGHRFIRVLVNTGEGARTPVYTDAVNTGEGVRTPVYTDACERG